MNLSPKYNDAECLRDDDVFFDEGKFMARFTSDEIDERFLQVLDKETAVEEYERNVEDRENRVRAIYNIYLMKMALHRIQVNAFDRKMIDIQRGLSLNRVIKNLEDRSKDVEDTRIPFMILKAATASRKREQELSEKSIKLSNKERVLNDKNIVVEKVKKACYLCVGLNILCFLYNIAK